MSDEPRLTLIARDARGESWALLLPDGQEIVLIKTLKGFWRGGHSHDCAETSIVLSGSMSYLRKDSEKVEKFIQPTGAVLQNPPHVVHAAMALEDCWLIDTRPGVIGLPKNTNDPDMRAYVESENKAREESSK